MRRAAMFVLALTLLSCGFVYGLGLGRADGERRALERVTEMFATPATWNGKYFVSAYELGERTQRSHDMMLVCRREAELAEFLGVLWVKGGEKSSPEYERIIERHMEAGSIRTMLHGGQYSHVISSSEGQSIQPGCPGWADPSSRAKRAP